MCPLVQSKLLTQYVLNLAKYDQNYDIRDRARFIRQLIVPTEKSGALNKYAKKLFLAQKPAPILESSFKGTHPACTGARCHPGAAQLALSCHHLSSCHRSGPFPAGLPVPPAQRQGCWVPGAAGLAR